MRRRRFRNGRNASLVSSLHAPEEPFDLFPWHREQVMRNLVEASGGNPNDPKAYDKVFKPPTKHGGSPAELVEAYLAGLPIADLFKPAGGYPHSATLAL
jgi:hypothetical protein